VKSIARLAVLPILLLAMLLQADAVVRSLVMQAGMGMAPAPVCSTHIAPAESAAIADHGALAGHATHHARCPYCEVAAQAAVFVAATPVPCARLLAFVSFSPLRARAPPTAVRLQPRARGPPLSV
jgi:hypothetical protein